MLRFIKMITRVFSTTSNRSKVYNIDYKDLEAKYPTITQWPANPVAGGTRIEVPYKLEDMDTIINYINKPTHQNYSLINPDLSYDLYIPLRDEWMSDDIAMFQLYHVAIDMSLELEEQITNTQQMAISLGIANIIVICLSEDVKYWKSIASEIYTISSEQDPYPISLPDYSGALYVYAWYLTEPSEIGQMDRNILRAIEGDRYVLFHVDPNRIYGYADQIVTGLESMGITNTQPVTPPWLAHIPKSIISPHEEDIQSYNASILDTITFSTTDIPMVLPIITKIQRKEVPEIILESIINSKKRVIVIIPDLKNVGKADIFKTINIDQKSSVPINESRADIFISHSRFPIRRYWPEDGNGYVIITDQPSVIMAIQSPVLEEVYYV